AKGKGTTDETLLQSQLIAQGDIVIKAVDGLKIDIKEVNQQTVSQTIDAMVQADPELAWLKEMEQRGDVDWHRVKEVHDSFKYSHSGLGGAAMMIIAIVVAYFTAGAASGLIGSAAGAGAGSGSAMAAAGSSAMVSAGTAVGTMGAGWANVALTAVATSATSSAAISTVNNRGDLGAVFKDVTSNDALKGYLVTGVTAGLTAGLYDQWTGTETTASSTSNAVGANTPLSNAGTVSVPGSGLSSWSGVGQFAANQALQNTTSAALSKLVGQDGSFSDALQSTLANTFMAAGFNWIGDVTYGVHNDGGPVKIGLHAVMGGLAAEAMGGDFKSGALAAGVNELLVANLDAQYQEMDDEQRQKLLVMNSQLIGVFTAALQGGDAESLQVASAVAGGATSYNYLNHAEAEERLEKHQACQAGDQMACDRRDQLDLLDKQRDEELKFACRGALESTACKSLRADAFTALESYGPYKDNAEWRALHDDLIRNDLEGYTKYSLAREYESVRDILAQTPAGLTNEAALAIVALLGQARGAGAVGGAKATGAAGDSTGAMRRLDYEAAPYHGKIDNAVKSRAPINGQDALDTSIQVKTTSPRRVGIDYESKEFVVFDKTLDTTYHGHVRSWKDLHPDMQKALQQAGMADRKGNILVGGKQ
ncbi:DUF637 domain-containing protein, partial [Phytopseudomonas dryadis]